MKKQRYKVDYVTENHRLRAKLQLVKQFQAPPPKVVPIRKAPIPQNPVQ